MTSRIPAPVKTNNASLGRPRSRAPFESNFQPAWTLNDQSAGQQDVAATQSTAEEAGEVRATASVALSKEITADSAAVALLSLKEASKAKTKKKTKKEQKL